MAPRPGAWQSFGGRVAGECGSAWGSSRAESWMDHRCAAGPKTDTAMIGTPGLNPTLPCVRAGQR